MRLALPLLAALTLSATVTAQPDILNEFKIYSGETDATSRSGLGGGSDGDVLVCVNTEDFQYVGNWCTTSTTPSTSVAVVDGFFAVIQDQNRVTLEQFNWVIAPSVPGTAGSQPPPDNSVVPDLLRTTNLTTPFVAGTGPVAWGFTVTLLTPFEDASMTTSTWYLGVGLPMNPAWTADGLSVHMSSFDGLGSPFGPDHGNPRLNAPNLTWARDNTNLTVAQPGAARSHNISIFTKGAVLNAGQDVWPAAQTTSTGQNPMWGQGGPYPDTSGAKPAGPLGEGARLGNGDGSAFRVRDAEHNGGPAFMFFAGGWALFPLKLAGIDGTIPLDITSLTQAPAASGLLTLNPATNQVEAVIAPVYMAQGLIPPGVIGSIYWMSVTVNATFSDINITNGARIDFL